LSMTMLTADALIRLAGDLSSESRVVLMGASGGVGIKTLQLLRDTGATVVAVASANKHAAVVKAADGMNLELVDYKAEDWKDRFKGEIPASAVTKESEAALYAAKLKEVSAEKLAFYLDTMWAEPIAPTNLPELSSEEDERLKEVHDAIKVFEKKVSPVSAKGSPDVVIDASAAAADKSYGKACSVGMAGGKYIGNNYVDPSFAKDNPKIFRMKAEYFNSIGLWPSYAMPSYSSSQPYAREVYAKVAKLVEEDKFELPEVTTFTPENMHEAFAFTIKSHSGAGGKAVIDMSNGVP